MLEGYLLLKCCVEQIPGTQEGAAEAYDVAAIKFRGVNAVTNFDITRYDVERIMASNTLLAGELARRKIETETSNGAIVYNPYAQTGGETIQLPTSHGNGSDWKMAFYESPQQPQSSACVDSLDQKSTCVGNYRSSSFSMATQDIMGIDSVNSCQPVMDESAARLGTHYSNNSSLVTSLSSSREASPDKTGNTMKSPISPLLFFPCPCKNFTSFNKTQQCFFLRCHSKLQKLANETWRLLLASARLLFETMHHLLR